MIPMNGQTEPSVQTPHLAPALAAVIITMAILAAFASYARSLENRSIMGLAVDEDVIERNGKTIKVRTQGIALQQAALDTGCLLLVCGASEQNVQVDYNRPFHPTNVFHDLPTGFTVFPVGRAENTCLLILQKLAALGPALSGRKVVITLSPSWFFDRLAARKDGYAGNFSALHAGEMVCNPRLSLQFKRDVARRMLQHPYTMAKRPILRCALEKLASGSSLDLACLNAILPLVVMHNALLRDQDHWIAVTYLWQHPNWRSHPVPPPSHRLLDWPTLHQQAEELYRAHSNNNELGVDNDKWILEVQQVFARQKASRSDDDFLDKLERSEEWIDLELLLRGLKELGAQPLLMNMPIHGGWYDRCGITYAARRAYYLKVREVCARYQTALADFADHDSDKFFCLDHLTHPSPRGFVYCCQVLDGFFHDAVPRQSKIPESAPMVSRGTEAGDTSRLAR
jgi:D-alanine transfer protein